MAVSITIILHIIIIYIVIILSLQLCSPGKDHTLSVLDHVILLKTFQWFLVSLRIKIKLFYSEPQGPILSDLQHSGLISYHPLPCSCHTIYVELLIASQQRRQTHTSGPLHLLSLGLKVFPQTLLQIASYLTSFRSLLKCYLLTKTTLGY